MESMIRKIAKTGIVVKYLWFIAGLQISAALELLLNLNLVDFSLQQFSLMLVSGLALGVSSFVSLVLASGIEEVIKAGESMIGTTLEKDREQEMDRALEKPVSMIFLGQMQRKSKITVVFCLDSLLTALGIGMAIVSRL
jgi:hypothetical protein